MDTQRFVHSGREINMKRKINDIEFQDLKEYAESLEKRLARLEKVLFNIIREEVIRQSYEEEWGSD